MAYETWSPTRLGDLIRVKHGWPFKSRLFSERLTGKPIVVNIGNFRYSGGFRFESTTTKEYRGDYPPEFELAPGETLLVMTCQTPGGEILGIPGRIPSDKRTYLHNQRLGKVEVEQPDRVDENFLYWLFHWSRFNRHLYVTASGSKILHTAPTRIESFDFDLPPLNEQRAIASVLGALDDKIELNRRMNETLEEMARALFKSWFVDFDPVRAKMEDRQFVGMDDGVAALFPDSFEDSPLGDIPKGWRVGEMQNIASQSRVTLNPGTEPEHLFDHYSIPAFDEGRVPQVTSGGLIKSNKFVVPENAVLLSRLNPRISRCWLPHISPSRQSVCSTEYIVALPKPAVTREFLFALFNSQPFVSQFQRLVTGTSGSHQRVKAEYWQSMEVLIPNAEIVELFSTIVRGLFLRVANNIEQNLTLATIRDTLLPELLSGKCRVTKAAQRMGIS